MTTPGISIERASKNATAEVAIPVFSGTLTTMAPFFPLLGWPGIMGEFMKYIPATIIITLSASMFVAYVMNPVFAVSFMRRDNGKKKNNYKRMFIVLGGMLVLAALLYIGRVFAVANLLTFFVLVFLLIRFALTPLIHKFQHSFIPLLKAFYFKTLAMLLKGRRAYAVIGFTIFLLFFSTFLLVVKSPKVILMAESDPSTIYTYIRMPAGTDIEVTDSVTRVVEEKIFKILGGKDNPDVESVIANVAVGAGQNLFERGASQPKLGKVTVTFVEYKYRTGPPTTTYLEDMREQLQGIPGAEIAVDVETMGPPTGKPISIEISGEDIDKLIAISERLLDFIDSTGIKGIEELKSDMEPHTPEIMIHVNREKANKLGVKTAMIGMALRTALYGSEVSKFREGEDEYDIRIRLKDQYRDNLDALMNIEIMAPGGRSGIKKIPLSAVADLRYSSSYGAVNRKDNKRVITLESNILSGYNANEIIQRLKKQMVNFPLDEGYDIKFAGEQDDQKEAADFLAMALFLAVGIILIILVAQFNSISKPFIILTQVLFSMIGVLFGLIILDLDFSVVLTGMGVIAVAGIVVKNAIILIDYTDILIAKGGPIRKAIITAGGTRLTPVLLTAASTILGLLPLATGLNINFATLFSEFNANIFIGGDMAAFWKPLAWAIIFGLAFATFLTLIVVPAMYFVIYAGKVKVKRMVSKISK